MSETVQKTPKQWSNQRKCRRKSSEKTKREHPSIGCCANSSKTSACELIHEVQAPQAVADLYQQKDHPSYRENWRLHETAGSQQYWKVDLRHWLWRYKCACLRENCHVTIIKKKCAGGNWHAWLPEKHWYLLLGLGPNTDRDTNYSTAIICPVKRGLSCSHIASWLALFILHIASIIQLASW